TVFPSRAPGPLAVEDARAQAPRAPGRTRKTVSGRVLSDHESDRRDREQQTWRAALAEAMAWMPPGNGEAHDLAFLFASPAYAEDFPELVAAARRATRARILLGCSGQGVIGAGREVEGHPALALLAFALPEAVLRPVRLTQGIIERCRRPEDWHAATGVGPRDAAAWFLFADPFT